jgi:hypothetical protein
MLQYRSIPFLILVFHPTQYSSLQNIMHPHFSFGSCLVFEFVGNMCFEVAFLVDATGAASLKP